MTSNPCHATPRRCGRGELEPGDECLIAAAHAKRRPLEHDAPLGTLGAEHGIPQRAVWFEAEIEMERAVRRGQRPAVRGPRRPGCRRQHEDEEKVDESHDSQTPINVPGGAGQETPARVPR